MSKKAISIKEIPNKNIQIHQIKMNRNAPIPHNENMPINRYNFALLISGPAGSGKSSVWVNLLQKRGMLSKKFNDIQIWSPSLHTIQKDIGIPEENIHQTMDMEELEEMLEYKRQMKIAGSEDETLFIIDDMIGELSNKYGSQILKMILNRAHMGLSIIFTSQSYTKAIPPIIRKNMNMVIQLNTMNKKELEAIREELTSFSKDEFNQLIRNTLKSPHDFLMFRNDGAIFRNFNLLEIDY